MILIPPFGAVGAAIAALVAEAALAGTVLYALHQRERSLVPRVRNTPRILGAAVIAGVGGALIPDPILGAVCGSLAFVALVFATRLHAPGAAGGVGGSQPRPPGGAPHEPAPRRPAARLQREPVGPAAVAAAAGPLRRELPRPGRERVRRRRDRRCPWSPCARTRDRLPGGRATRALSYAVGDRYFGLDEPPRRGRHRALRRSRDVVQRAGGRTQAAPRLPARADGVGDDPVARDLPLAARARYRRARSLAATDLFLAASERARDVPAARGRRARADRRLLSGHRHRATSRRSRHAPAGRARASCSRRAGWSGRRATRT